MSLRKHIFRLDECISHEVPFELSCICCTAESQLATKRQSNRYCDRRTPKVQCERKKKVDSHYILTLLLHYCFVAFVHDCQRQWQLLQCLLFTHVKIHSVPCSCIFFSPPNGMNASECISLNDLHEMHRIV